MPYYTSEPSVIEVGYHTSDSTRIERRNYGSDWTTLETRHFSSDAVEEQNSYTIPGGFLTWTVEKPNIAEMHAARVHSNLSGSVPPYVPHSLTAIGEMPIAEISSGDGALISPFYTSPQVYINSEKDVIFTATSQGLAIFEYKEDSITRLDQIPPSHHGPLVTATAIDSQDSRSVCWYMESGSLYFSLEQA